MQSHFGSVDILLAKCYHKQRRLGVAQFGSVLDWGSRGRRFKSFHPDQKSPVTHVLRGFLLFVCVQNGSFNPHLYETEIFADAGERRLENIVVTVEHAASRAQENPVSRHDSLRRRDRRSYADRSLSGGEDLSRLDRNQGQYRGRALASYQLAVPNNPSIIQNKQGNPAGSSLVAV